MLGNIIIILITSWGMGWLLEKLNQSKLEPFEKIQAKTRYLSKKKVWKYSLLIVTMVTVCTFSLMMDMQMMVINVLLGITVAVIDVIFESTIFDQMRNTLR